MANRPLNVEKEQLPTRAALFEPENLNCYRLCQVFAHLGFGFGGPDGLTDTFPYSLLTPTVQVRRHGLQARELVGQHSRLNSGWLAYSKRH